MHPSVCSPRQNAPQELASLLWLFPSICLTPNPGVGGFPEIWALLRVCIVVWEKPDCLGGPQDFGDPAVVLFEDMDFQGHRVEVSSALPDVELAQHGPSTQAIHVLSGV